MPKYRKKPVVIDAFKMTAEYIKKPHEAWPVWLYDELWCSSNETGCVWFAENGAMIIKTLEGDMTVNVDDWIIKGVKGELYPCKPGIFEATYEPAAAPDLKLNYNNPQVGT